jgi:hypothetical protein
MRIANELRREIVSVLVVGVWLWLSHMLESDMCEFVGLDDLWLPYALPFGCPPSLYCERRSFGVGSGCWRLHGDGNWPMGYMWLGLMLPRGSSASLFVGTGNEKSSPTVSDSPPWSYECTRMIAEWGLLDLRQHTAVWALNRTHTFIQSNHVQQFVVHHHLRWNLHIPSRQHFSSRRCGRGGRNNGEPIQYGGRSPVDTHGALCLSARSAYSTAYSTPGEAFSPKASSKGPLRSPDGAENGGHCMGSVSCTRLDKDRPYALEIARCNPQPLPEYFE